MLSTYSSYDHAQAFSEFLAYKTRVPVRGAILLNERMDEVLLVKGWKKGANWSFPRGKINKDEPDLDCAIREVYEETGYDVHAAGLVASRANTKYIEMNLREQHMRLYVFRGIPMDTYFAPRTRKEISKIQWWKLSDLPTLKKKKPQQDGQGGDLAISGNKFYMVAPFLPQLKKWISAQRKADKTRKASTSATPPAIIGEESAIIGDHDIEEETVQHSINGDMGKLLEGLRQSAQPAKASDLPGVAADVNAAEDVAAQLKNFLGVPITSPAVHGGTERPPASDTSSDPKADGLLALLQSKPTYQAQPPQTPMEQVIEHPSLPVSPPHPHHQSQRFSSMPPPPAFPSQNQMLAVESQKSQRPQPPQVRAIPPPQQPAQLIPRQNHLPYNKPPPRQTYNQPVVAPYQRTGDPQFAQSAQAPGKQLSSIPRASNLPPPKLNAQSSALLNLFKAGPPAKAPNVTSSKEIASDKLQQAFTNTPTLNEIQVPKDPRSGDDLVRVPSQDKQRQGSRPTNMFVPAQVLSRGHSVKGNGASQSNAGHHDKLLSLFRSPPTATAEPIKPATPTLQLPSGPIELSALPKTPGHSREPSRNNEHVKEQAALSAQNGLAESEKRPRRTTASLQNPPVSATINGPMNVPQFEMVVKASKDARDAMHRKDQGQSFKRSPIRILARPTSSQGQPAAPTHQTPMESAQVTKQPKAAAPKIQTVVTPVKKPPPKPDLKGHEAPPKAFHPQILRRPAHLDDSNEPSPIQPLPSPKHNVLTERHSTQPTDHKKSLLSLFTKPSPAVSPPSATAPGSAIDPSALISPLTGPTPKEQAENAFARLTNSVGKLSHETDKIPEPSQLRMLRTGSINSAAAGGSKPGPSGEKQTPVSKTTPGDKAFLLGFLNSVAEGGR